MPRAGRFGRPPRRGGRSGRDVRRTPPRAEEVEVSRLQAGASVLPGDLSRGAGGARSRVGNPFRARKRLRFRASRLVPRCFRARICATSPAVRRSSIASRRPFPRAEEVEVSRLQAGASVLSGEALRGPPRRGGRSGRGVRRAPPRAVKLRFRASSWALRCCRGGASRERQSPAPAAGQRGARSGDASKRCAPPPARLLDDEVPLRQPGTRLSWVFASRCWYFSAARLGISGARGAGRSAMRPGDLSLAGQCAIANLRRRAMIRAVRGSQPLPQRGNTGERRLEAASGFLIAVS